MTKQKSQYTVNLVDLHSLCEGNYARMLQLFPDYEQRNTREIIAGQTRVMLAVTERCRYTTSIRLTHWSPLARHLGGVDLDIRLYHDAHMAEVVGFQSHRRVAGRYQYPNPHMYQRDEKHQQNRYVADLLAFCAREGMEPDLNAVLGEWESGTPLATAPSKERP